VPIKEIVCRTGRSRKLVRQVIRGERNDVFRVRQSSLDAHLPWLDAQWAASPFHDPQKAAAERPPWIAQARQSLVASFGNGVEKDEAAVRQLSCHARMDKPRVRSHG
jgi:hypothetical protein